METIKLYRPIGLTEMELIAENNYKTFPPRFEWQPIFYPVINQAYAEQIADEWNTRDEFSGYCGIVTAFQINVDFIKKYEVKNVGGIVHNELWIPSNELENFNNNIIGVIAIVNAFFGSSYKVSKNEELESRLNSFRTKSSKNK
jgi:hypothetical protein